MHRFRVSRRFAALLAASGLLAGAVPSVGAAGPAAADRFTATSLQPTGTISVNLDKAVRTNDGRVAVIVKLRDASVASYRGGVRGYTATSPRALGTSRIDVTSRATVDYRRYLRGKQESFVRGLAVNVPSARVTGRFDLVLDAVSAVVPEKAIQAVASLPDVAAILPDSLQHPDTDVSPQFIGAPTAWSALGGQESAGENVIVGLLDTGIWPEHPSFSDPDPSGKPYSAPAPAPDGSRACQFSGGANPGPAFTCNNKLIGAARFMATYDAVIGLAPGEFTSARDDDGHGTHTSSTAAGNAGVHASIFGIDRGVISGIAPRAHVEMFKVCGEQGCFSSDTAAATEAAIGDGVNVINFSISGGANPFSDATELAFLDAYNAGIFVAASAGNSGPTPDTTDHRGPWVTTVAASTTNRAFVDTLTLSGTGGASLSLAGVSLTKGVGPAPIVVNTADPFCLIDAAPGTFTGEIVVCERGGGGGGRAEKGKFVFDGGAVGMVLYNQSTAVTDQETDNHFLPATHIQFNQGQQVLAFIAANPGATATLTQGVKGTQQGDVLASFSSRGGPNQSLGVSKPDIAAPGVQILAGASPQHVGVASGPQGELFQAIAGTSMASPHIAGSGALIKALHPSWTPGQIKSALMTTALGAGLVKEDGTTPFDAFDAGSGRVDLRYAGDPGLTFDATGASYVANAANLFMANYPSVYVPSMPGMISVPRTAHSVLSRPSNWQLSASSPSDLVVSVPHTIHVAAGGNAAFSISIDATNVPLGQTRFATVTLRQVSGGHRVLHMPVTIVRNQAVVKFDKTCTPTTVAPNGTTTCTLTASNPTFNAATYAISDTLPNHLHLIRSSVTGGSVVGNTKVVASGVLPGAQPPTVAVAPGTSPAGYLPLSLFGIAPVAGVGDDTITNFNVPTFSFGGETWSRIGVGSNGYVVIGGGSGADVSISNQNFPNPTPPNNVIAPFWTDLNPGAAGAIRVGTLTDGADTWIVLDWDGVREYSTGANLHSFEIWIGIDTDANPGEDVSMAFGPNVGTGDGGFASTGAENKFGNSGQATYFNGTGTYPADGTQLVVTTTPGTSSSATVTFSARADHDRGPWRNCATLTSSAFLGTSVSCVSGTIH